MTGLAPDEARAYRMLLRMPAASAGDLAMRLGVSAADARACLRRLESQGLVGRLPGTDQRFRAAAPDRAFGPLIRRRRDELKTIRADVEALASAYVRDASRRGGDQLVEMLHWPDARDCARQASAAAVSDVSALVMGATWDIAPSVVPPVAPPLAPHPASPLAPTSTEVHTQYRLVYPRAAVGDTAVQGHLVAAIRADHLVRAADRIPLSLLVVDRALAVLPVRAADCDHAALVVHPGGLLDGLLALFEHTWAVASGLAVGGDGVVREDPAASAPTDGDLRLLGLLLDGLTDEAIAGKLGIGPRTVQRRVRDLIELAGVRTRLQLIWEATRRGWI